MVRHFFQNLERYFFIIITINMVFSGIVLAAGERYSVQGTKANIRSGPGTDFEILVQAEKNYPVRRLNKSGKWIQVMDFEGDIGWIHQSLIRKIATVITIKSKCNIRSGPGRKYDILLISDHGVPFKVLKRKAEWIHVQHSEGYEGWIHRSLVW